MSNENKDVEVEKKVLELNDEQEVNLLYQVLRTGNASLAQNGNEPEVLAAVANLLIRVKNML